MDETRIPKGIESFKCPKCKREIPLSYLDHKLGQDSDAETLVISPKAKDKGIGRFIVFPDIDTPRQEFQLNEGIIIVGRKAKVSTANICIQTEDKTMSRSHIRIEVKKNPKGGYFHYLSDNNSKNNTLYNGKCIENGDMVVLKDNDEIVMGRTIIRFNE
ncbi:MAG: FHA domain-containing protein [Tannerella sp.]|nr:FHA domain-containing protein [Tannerella sp.]